MNEKCEVIILEDDKGTLQLMKGHFESLSITVFATTDSASALAAAETHPPVLFVAGFHNGDGNPDGFEVVKKLRGSARTKNIQIWVVSATMDEETEGELLKLGANWTCPKDIHFFKNLLAKAQKEFKAGEQ